jgi:hypothetical protein
VRSLSAETPLARELLTGVVPKSPEGRAGCPQPAANLQNWPDVCMFGFRNSAWWPSARTFGLRGFPGLGSSHWTARRFRP